MQAMQESGVTNNTPLPAGANAAREPRPCPLCQSATGRPVFADGEWVVVRCGSCGMVYLNASLSYTRQAADHDWSASSDTHHSKRDRSRPGYRLLRPVTRRLRSDRQQRMLSQVRRVCREGRLLDVGCGDGQLMESASRYFEVTGVEITEELAAAALRRAPGASVIIGPASEAALGEDAFDVAAMISFIEHEQNPRALLLAVFRALKPGGWLVVKTPDHASWPRRLQGAAWCGYRLPDHCNYFTHSTLERMLRETGFTARRPSLAERLRLSDNLWCFARKP